MLALVASVTERSTAATDLILAAAFAWAAWHISSLRSARVLRARIWCGAFGAMALASALGALAHGLVLVAAVAGGMWFGLNLCLGLAIALFMTGAVLDGWGEAAARRGLKFLVAAGLAFPLGSMALGGAFWIFLAYESLAMGVALAIYLGLAWRGRLAGAWGLVLGIALNLAAAAVQTTDWTLRLVWPLDHNGLFHLVQLLAVPVLARGVSRGFRGA